MSSETSSPPAPEKQAAVTIFLNFSFFKVDPKWRWLNEIGKEEAAKEFASLVDVANTKMKVRTYSTLGLREDADIMFWMISDTVEKTQVMASKIYSTVLGKYLTQSYVFLSAMRPSVYSSKVIPSFMTDAQPLKYCIVYPFVKSREWYLLPFEERKKMMDEHIAVGRKFPQVRLNTTSSFGLDDQDFMLAFETEDLMAFQELIMQLRETKVSKYVVRDTPMIVCVHREIEEIIKSLG
ncbi:putative chlorite dismutase [Candidatus Nitrososphaera gargensis Ga9.2]|uniref:Putative chlorite dismutase n=1 Tax=Nitrososphaera gargensis (strain Ga9.2) TaxID=1237085 RepID=K0IKJ2_NITGG|nr:chlorite dismutase family protein [Candidatus Nitrososphaera gargensis]AFU59798.1 putative chlorite dismutase [Candidatus Nitrososphaera gargensis Ga9.2]